MIKNNPKKHKNTISKKKSKKTNKPNKYVKLNMIIIDTNICSLLYIPTQIINQSKKGLDELITKLNVMQKNNELYITESVKNELNYLYIDNKREALQKIWNTFKNKTLKDSYEYLPQINEICKTVTDGIKDMPWVKKKIDDTRMTNQIKYKSAKKKFNEYLPKWENGDTDFNFYPIVKRYDTKKEINDSGKQNIDQLLIEFPDRVILSTAVYYAKMGHTVSLYTRDGGICVLAEKMKDLSVIILGLYPKSKIRKTDFNHSTRKRQNYNKQLTSNITDKQADDLQDEFLDN